MKKLFILALLLTTVILSASFNEKKALNILQPIKATDYPESHQVSASSSVYKLDKHCVGTITTETYTKVLTDTGKMYSSKLFYGYDSMYDSLYVESINVFKADGKKVSYDPNKILSRQINAYTKQMNIYSETSWLLTGSLPDIQVGDIIKTVNVRLTKRARLEDNFNDLIMLESFSPTAKFYVEVNMPTSKKLYVHHTNKKEDIYKKLKHSKTEKDGITTYTWEGSNTDIIIPEQNMEDFRKIAYYLTLTTVESWEYISKWYYNLVNPHLEIHDGIRQKVVELTKDAKTRYDKAASIFYWVAREIRYLGVDKETNRPGYEPHDVIYTFDTRGGVCRDKSALLVAMLEEAGIKANPIIIASGYQLDPKAPVMMFNHAVVVSYDENGEPEYFFDPTDENTRDFFPQYQEDCSYLTASKNGDTLKLVPVSPSSKNPNNISIDMVIDEDYNAKAKFVAEFKGLGDTILRQVLSRMSPKQQKQLVQTMVNRVHPDAKIISQNITDAKDMKNDMKMEAEFTIDGYIASENGYIFIPVEATKLDLSFLYEYQLSAFRPSERTYDFKLPSTFSLNINQKIELPFEVSKVSMPQIPEIDAEGFDLKQGYDIKDKSINYFCKFSIDKLHFKANEYLGLKKQLGSLDNMSKFFLVGQK